MCLLSPTVTQTFQTRRIHFQVHREGEEKKKFFWGGGGGGGGGGGIAIDHCVLIGSKQREKMIAQFICVHFCIQLIMLMPSENTVRFEHLQLQYSRYFSSLSCMQTPFSGVLSCHADVYQCKVHLVDPWRAAGTTADKVCGKPWGTEDCKLAKCNHVYTLYKANYTLAVFLF